MFKVCTQNLTRVYSVIVHIHSSGALINTTCVIFILSFCFILQVFYQQCYQLEQSMRKLHEYKERRRDNAQTCYYLIRKERVFAHTKIMTSP